MKSPKQATPVPHVDLSGKKKPTVISTFAGAGGSSLGYKLAGFQELLAVEFDPHAIEVFKMNFPGVPVFTKDIKLLSSKHLFEITKTKPGELDVFDGSPPCQGFSSCGKHDLNDDRNLLFEEFARLLIEIQPKSFVMENVSGMIKGHMKRIFIKILSVLRDCGYQVKAELLNAQFFNVPQRRRRVIFVGIRNDLNLQPTHPKPTSQPIILRKALEDCPNDKEQRMVCSKIAKVLPYMTSKTDANKRKILFKKVLGKSSGYINTMLLAWGEVPPTLCKQEIAHTGLIHPDKQRYLSLSEAKRICSFPDDFKFVGGRKKGIERLGNAVPPKMMEAIALHIRSILNV